MNLVIDLLDFLADLVEDWLGKGESLATAGRWIA